MEQLSLSTSFKMCSRYACLATNMQRQLWGQMFGHSGHTGVSGVYLTANGPCEALVRSGSTMTTQKNSEPTVSKELGSWWVLKINPKADFTCVAPNMLEKACLCACVLTPGIHKRCACDWYFPNLGFCLWTSCGFFLNELIPEQRKYTPKWHPTKNKNKQWQQQPKQNTRLSYH